jgi:hypothetical protein
MILDYQCFLKDNLVISLPKFNCTEGENDIEVFDLDANFSVHFFIQLIATQQELQTPNINSDRALTLLKNIAVEILNLDNSKKITLKYINKHFDDLKLLQHLFVSIQDYANGLYNKEIYKLPDIQVKRQGVDSYANLIKKDDYEVMEGVTLIMQNTSNSFSDVMKMPYSCYLETIKQVRLNQLLQDEEWRKEYIQYKYKIEYKNGNVERHTKPDLNGLRNLASML